jgi:hypothetical protein
MRAPRRLMTLACVETGAGRVATSHHLKSAEFAVTVSQGERQNEKMEEQATLTHWLLPRSSGALASGLLTRTFRSREKEPVPKSSMGCLRMLGVFSPALSSSLSLLLAWRRRPVGPAH